MQKPKFPLELDGQNNEDYHESPTSVSTYKQLKAKFPLSEENASRMMLTITLAACIICVLMALLSIPISKRGGFPGFTGVILFLGILTIIGISNYIHPPKKGKRKKYSNKVWIHEALQKTPLWMQIILLIYWIVIFILVPISIPVLPDFSLFLIFSGLYLFYFAQLYGDHINPTDRRSKRPRKPKPRNRP